MDNTREIIRQLDIKLISWTEAVMGLSVVVSEINSLAARLAARRGAPLSGSGDELPTLDEAFQLVLLQGGKGGDGSSEEGG